MADEARLADALGAGSRRTSWIVGLLLGAAVVAVAIASFAVQRGPDAEKVRVVEAARRPVTSRVLAQGRVRAKRQVEVTSEISGRVTAVFVEVGDRVKVGDPLFALDDEQLKNATAQLRVALRAAQAMETRARLAADEAKRNLERDQRLREKNVLAEDVLRTSAARAELARADLAQASAAVERARLDLLRAEDALGKARVVAPLEGTVVEVSLEVGQVVAPLGTISQSSGVSGLGGLGGLSQAGGTGSIVIADLSELIARLDVDELDVARVKEGQPVKLTALSGEGVPLDGVISRVGLMGRDAGGAVQFPVEAQVLSGAVAPTEKGDAGPVAEVAPEGPAPREGAPLVLRPGMTVSAEIEVERLPDAVAIPVAAVLEGDGQEGGKPDRVLLVDESVTGATVKETPVKLGPTDQEVVAVLSGLKAGQRIVEGPFRALRSLEDGDAVEIDEAVPLPGARAGGDGGPSP